MRFFHCAEQNLIEFIRQREQFVVIDLNDERNLVRVFSRDRAQHAERRSDTIAATFDGKLDDVFRIEVLRIRGERSTGGMLNALVNRKNRNVTRSREATVINQRLK